MDELIVVDTGSVDETPRIAAGLGARLFSFPWCDADHAEWYWTEDLGARLFSFPWCDEFAAARTGSLRHARGDWLFWMDSDDTIDAGCGARLRQLALGDAAASLLGYVVQVHCPGGHEDGVREVTAVDHVKLIRNRADLRFEGRIHDQVLPAIRRAGGDVAWTELYVVHSGSAMNAAWLRLPTRGVPSAASAAVQPPGCVDYPGCAWRRLSVLSRFCPPTK